MSDEIKPRGEPINAPQALAHYRAMRAELEAKVASGEITIEEATTARKNFGGNLIVHRTRPARRRRRPCSGHRGADR